MASTRALGHAPWSASKVQTALRCPRLFHYRYVEKMKEPEVMPETRIGKAVHAALEHSIAGMLVPQAVETGAKDVANEDERARYEHLCETIPAFLERLASFREKRRVSRQLIEYTMAISDTLKSTAFYAGNALFRGIIDLGYLYGDGNLAVLDHKSGQKHPHMSIADQLEGYAVLAAASFRHTRRVILGVHWVQSGEVEWAPPMSTEHIHEELLPRTLANIEAAALAVSDGPRATPSSWCLRCSYRSVCDVGRDMRFEPVEEEINPWEE